MRQARAELTGASPRMFGIGMPFPPIRIKSADGALICPVGFSVVRAGTVCLLAVYSFGGAHSRIALILRTPADEDCSLTILKRPSSPVRAACGPPHISREKVPIE